MGKEAPKEATKVANFHDDYEREFTVVITKTGAEGIGIDINRNLRTCLRVTKLKDGPIKTWNAEHPEAMVQLEDRIISVNGERGGAEKLVTRIREDTRIEMVIHRPKAASAA